MLSTTPWVANCEAEPKRSEISSNAFRRARYTPCFRRDPWFRQCDWQAMGKTRRKVVAQVRPTWGVLGLELCVDA
eukprot:8059475-Heterocapsa_arctica.AAC.1